MTALEFIDFINASIAAAPEDVIVAINKQGFELLKSHSARLNLKELIERPVYLTFDNSTKPDFQILRKVGYT